MTTSVEVGGSSASGDRTGSLAGKGSYVLLALLVLFLDQLSKGLIETSQALYASRPVIPGFLSFTHVRNSGVAFGLFANQGSGRLGAIVLTPLGLAALGIVGLYFWRTPSADRLLLAALGAIMGGAVGNLLDRIGSGGVTDFIDVYVGTHHWHTFNIADSAITIGIGLMVIDLFWPSKSSQAPPRKA